MGASSEALIYKFEINNWDRDRKALFKRIEWMGASLERLRFKKFIWVGSKLKQRYE